MARLSFWSNRDLCEMYRHFIWIEKGLCEMAWPYFWSEKWSCEMAQPFFDHKKGHDKRHIRYFCRGVLHTPLQDVPKRNVWSESRYIWGVCNTPLPWRTKRSISKINFMIIRIGIGVFLIQKMVMRNWLSFYMNRKRVMRDGTTLFLIWKMVM